MAVDVRTAVYSRELFAPMTALLRSYFPASDRLLTPGYTDWLYLANPFGTAVVVRATDGDRWVAFMAMIPVELQASCGIARAYYVVNVLVDPEYQGQHLFGKMITAAKGFVANEGAALLGHPNAAALPSWKRARMVFHEDLRPVLAIPAPFSGIRRERIMDRNQIAGAASMLSEVTAGSSSWRVKATPDYLAWRYLRHPSNVYVLQLLHVRDAVAGVQVTKKLKPGAHLLVDEFALPQHASAALRRLPLFTLCFWPESATRDHPGQVVKLPWRKRIPVFFTPGTTPSATAGIVHLGLSPSDF